MKYLELEYEELLENEYFNMDDDSYDDPGSDDSGDPGDTSGDSGGGEETESSSSMASNARKKAMETVSKALKQKAKKMSLAKPLGMLLWKIFFILVIIIIIIGIIMFLATMPGMVMEKLKTLSRKVGNAFASFFGEDTITQVSDEEIYETLTYLEKMGYDIKGEGFLTGYVGDDNGVEKDENGKIIDAVSDFIFTYIVSENYVYTLANENMVTSGEGLWGGIQGLGVRLLNLLTAGQAQSAWANGFINIYNDGGTLGHKNQYYRDNWITGDKITIDAEAKTLEIKRGHFNKSVTYNLDGWTGRYGMPMDFLISLHKATLMPDLSYDLATTFETQLLMLLHPLEHGTAVGYYKNDNGEYVSWNQFHEFSASGIIDGWRVNRKEARNIMKALNINSPSTCLGTIDGYDNDEINEKLVFTTYQNYAGQTVDNSEEQKEKTIEQYNLMMNKLRQYGYKNDMSDLPSSISSFDSFKELIPSEGNSLSKTIEWVDESINEDYSEYEVKIILEYVNEEGTSGGYQNIDGVVDTYTNNHYARIYYKMTKYWSAEKIQKYLEENNLTTTEEAKCSNNLDTLEDDKVCESCRKYIQKIYNAVSDVDVENWEIYQPYLANVTNHWYRDVYFVSGPGDPKNFVELDYDYESIMKERWTLYETDSSGEYILYELDENGEYKLEDGNLVVFEGTQEEAEEQGIAVSKKAKTESIINTYEDLGWNLDEESSIYSAYEVENQIQKEFAKVHLDVSGDNIDSQIKDRLYVELETNGNVVQIGEGQRTETNPKIKKMFLQNSYFRYDGNPQTAEIITSLRTAVKNANLDGEEDVYEGFGALSDAELEITTEIDGKTHKVADYAGKVLLNQDALNAFSMLENTHTLDSDYIYRDFKELVVELGYFTKEELTDETPRLLQFLIPGIANGGYPEASIDKTEYVDNGTMIHSKYDIDANKKNTLIEIYKRTEEAIENGEIDEDSDGAILDEELINISGTNISGINTPTLNSSYNATSMPNVEQIIGSMGQDFERIPEEGDGYKFKVRTGSVEYTHYFQKEGSYASSTFTWAGQQKTISRAGCGPTSCINLLTGYGYDVNPTNDIIGINFGATIYSIKEFMESYGVTGESYRGLTDAEFIAKIEEAFSQGRPIITLMNAQKTGDTFWTSGGHFVAMAGQDTNGNIITLDPTGYRAERQTYPGGVEGLMSTLVAVWIADEAPEGSAKSGGRYEGFKGNEAVVSPVTGILLEYGTYDSEIENTETGEEYRVNVDLKYISPFEAGAENQTLAEGTPQDGAGEPEPGEETPNEETQIGRSVSDKVGYAKILVLDKMYYEILETKLLAEYPADGILKNTFDINEGYLNSNGGFLRNAIATESLLEQIEDEGNTNRFLEETLYGYKEFAELYEDFGIAGYTIYIDGFKCELPDEDFEASTDMQTEEIPDGETLSMNTFKISVSDLDNPGELIQSQYEMPAKYKMSSKKVTERLNVEEVIKAAASPAVSVDDIIFIKEGTVLGRTYTGKEVITQLRGEEVSDYVSSNVDAAANPEQNENKLIGNYLRVSMKTSAIDGEKDIENVEDYMKLDEAGVAGGVFGDLESITESSTDVEKVRAAMSYFIGQGFTAEAAAGILGNLIQESALNPGADNNAGYIGLAQWSTSWWPTQKEWMESIGYNPESFAGQIRSIYESPNTGSISVGGGYEAMKVLTNIDQATEFFMVYYEGCVGGSDPTQYYKVGTNYQETNNRKRFAHNAYNIYMGNNSIGIKD